jgi:cytochrome c-type biogenesis protein CcmH
MRRKIKLIFFMLILMNSFSVTVQAALEVREFKQPEQEQRYYHLIDELRCLVCQNQNLADSNSQLALDLRNRVYEMINANKSDQEVIDYMVNRYGEYVLYNPPFNPVTAILWLGPFLGLFIALFWLFFYISKRNKSQAIKLSEEDRKRSQQLLDNSEESDDNKSDKP